MTVIADGKRRVTLPKPFKAGDAFDCAQEGNRLVLVRLERPTRPKPGKVTITQRKGRHPVGTVAGVKTITAEQVKALLTELP